VSNAEPRSVPARSGLSYFRWRRLYRTVAKAATIAAPVRPPMMTPLRRRTLDRPVP